MIERVVAAIDRVGLEFINEHPMTGWADVPSEVFARAAIEAMREPTSQMVEVGGVRPIEWSRVVSVQDTYDLARVKWREMIDAALADGAS